MFFGEYRHTMDAKGRISLPAKFRELLGNEFYFSLRPEGCVSINPPDQWQKFTEEVATKLKLPLGNIARYFNSSTKDGSFDSQGRVTIPITHKEYAKLGKEVVIIGNNTYIELWSVEAWEEIQKSFNSEIILKELIDNGF